MHSRGRALPAHDHSRDRPRDSRVTRRHNRAYLYIYILARRDGGDGGRGSGAVRSEPGLGRRGPWGSDVLFKLGGIAR